MSFLNSRGGSRIRDFRSLNFEVQPFSTRISSDFMAILNFFNQ